MAARTTARVADGRIRGLIIRSFRAYSSNPDGIRLMRHMGLTETLSSVPGMRDFALDVEASSSPFAVEYKQAYARRQATPEHECAAHEKTAT